MQTFYRSTKKINQLLCWSEVVVRLWRTRRTPRTKNDKRLQTNCFSNGNQQSIRHGEGYGFRPFLWFRLVVFCMDNGIQNPKSCTKTLRGRRSFSISYSRLQRTASQQSGAGKTLSQHRSNSPVRIACGHRHYWPGSGMELLQFF